MPAADDVGRLQRASGAEGELFRKVAEQGHYAGRTTPSDTRQGIYAAAPSGVLLGSVNSREWRKVRAMLTDALARWDELGHDERLLAKLPRVDTRGWQDRYPEDGLALRVSTRDVERDDLPHDWRGAAYNLDYAWFTRAEMLELLPGKIERGARGSWPAELVTRLARCHLVDDVRGQVISFKREEILRAELESTVLAVEDTRVELEFRGTTQSSAKGRWAVDNFTDAANPGEQTRGYEAELAGRATFDRSTERFTHFELVAVGSRFGGYKFNERADDLAPAPMGVSFTLAGTSPAERIPPARIADYGWSPP